MFVTFPKNIAYFESYLFIETWACDVISNSDVLFVFLYQKKDNYDGQLLLVIALVIATC